MLKICSKTTGEHACYNGSYTTMAKPIKTLELHYPPIQVLQGLIFAIFPTIRKNKFPQINVYRKH